MSHKPDSNHVAQALIPPSKPPASETGATGWLRRNLFSGVIDSALTLVAVFPILLVVPPLVDWALLKAVWRAGSLDECRAIIAAAHGAAARGACWAIFDGRIGLLMFGQYPPEVYWRPAVACVLLVPALAPMLFDRLPRWMLWFSLAYPAIAYVLIWGGMGLVPVDSDRPGGLLLTLVLAISGFVVAVAVGLLLALGRLARLRLLGAVCAALTEVLRGVPLVVLMVAGIILVIYSLPAGTGIETVLLAVLFLALARSVHMAEAIRAGFAAVPWAQYEAAAALGLGYRQTMRLVILPQALTAARPRIAHAGAGLFRDTTLVAFIGLLDPVGILALLRAAAQWDGTPWELFAVVALLYWLPCFLISRYAASLDQRAAAPR